MCLNTGRSGLGVADVSCIVDGPNLHHLRFMNHSGRPKVSPVRAFAHLSLWSSLVCFYFPLPLPFPRLSNICVPWRGASFALRYDYLGTCLVATLGGGLHSPLVRVTLLPSILQDRCWLNHSCVHSLPFVPCSSCRGSFLALLLRECFRDLGWLATIHSVGGDVGLLVTSIVPQTPFFWAMHVTEVQACWWSSWASVPPHGALLGSAC